MRRQTFHLFFLNFSNQKIGRSDIILQFPPYLIALTALHMASCQLDRDLTSWFAELSVDLNKILEISKEILRLYEIWNLYKEDEALAKILKLVFKTIVLIVIF